MDSGSTGLDIVLLPMFSNSMAALIALRTMDDVEDNLESEEMEGVPGRSFDDATELGGRTD